MKKCLFLIAMLSSAISISAQLPYTCNFASADDFSADWWVLNPEDDYCKWEFYEWETNSADGSGCASCGSWNGTNNDWLVKKTPLQLSAGKHHLTFYSRETPDENPEVLAIYFGTEADTTAMKQGTTSMTQIGEFSISNSTWRMRVANFDVPADGQYYFAFQSKTTNAYMMTLDDITIGEGDYQTSPSLSIVKALLPYSNCDLSEQSTLGLRLTNNGTGATSSFTISYSINGGQTVTQTVTDQLAPDQTKDYYFTQPANLLDLGDYAITLGFDCNGQTETTTATVSHYAPITELPVVTDFSTDANVGDTWTLLGTNSWSYSTWSGYYECNATGIDNAMLSRCITFNNPFRVKIAYTGGSYYGPAGFYLAYGRPNTDISTWTKIYEDDNIMGDVTKEVTVAPSEPGDYSLAIVDASSSTFKMTCIYNVTISEVLPHDVCIESAVSPLAACTPASHLTGTATYTAKLTNRGQESLSNVVVSLKKGTQTLAASAPVATLAAGDSATVAIEAALQGVKAGDNISLTLEAAAAETDDYAADNVLTLPTVLATDTVFATESLTEFELGTGAYSSTIAFGNVYTLAQTDTLTSVSVGLTSEYWGNEGDKLGIALYSLKDDGQTIDRQLLNETYERSLEGGLVTYTFAPRVLPAGKYFVEVAQLETTMLGVAYTEDANGICYQAIDGVLQSTPGAFLAIRANFAEGAKAYKKNVAVRAITKPTQPSALFTSSETIEATVENLASETATGVSVRCQVGDNDKTVSLTLQPYETQTVSFEGIDLATPGTYELTIQAALDGDEDTADNAQSLTLTSEKEESPYTLDFEHCKDFATGHEFNPRWWTVNRKSDNETDNFFRFDYPHSAEKGCGFIAFNVAATTPDMTSLDESEQVPGFFAHEGERFGAAFCVGPDWSQELDYTLQSDTWLVSPRLQLNTNSSLELYVKTHAIESQGIELEQYRLLISTTDDNLSSFTQLGADREAPTDWTKVTVDLSQYDNSQVYLALQYFGTVFKNVVMMVDDINVKTDGILTGIETVAPGTLQVSAREGLLTVQASDAIRSIQVLDASGKTVHAASSLSTDFYRQQLGAATKGVYIVRVATDAGVTVRKMVIQ